MRELRSLGYRTDLFVCAFDGIVTDRGRYIVVHTPSNPGFWWGNYLLYPDAPDALAAGHGHEGAWLEDLRDFVVKQCARYRAMQGRGLGQWYGAVVDGAIAAALGIVRDRELGRFQLVGTDPKYGRRGVCSTLVHDAAQLALAKEPGIATFVMAADATYHAAKVYESVGFRPTERLIALLKKPPRI